MMDGSEEIIFFQLLRLTTLLHTRDRRPIDRELILRSARETPRQANESENWVINRYKVFGGIWSLLIHLPEIWLVRPITFSTERTTQVGMSGCVRVDA